MQLDHGTISRNYLVRIIGKKKLMFSQRIFFLLKMNFFYTIYLNSKLFQTLWGHSYPETNTKLSFKCLTVTAKASTKDQSNHLAFLSSSCTFLLPLTLEPATVTNGEQIIKIKIKIIPILYLSLINGYKYAVSFSEFLNSHHQPHAQWTPPPFLALLLLSWLSSSGASILRTLTLRPPITDVLLLPRPVVSLRVLQTPTAAWRLRRILNAKSSPEKLDMFLRMFHIFRIIFPIFRYVSAGLAAEKMKERKTEDMKRKWNLKLYFRNCFP